MGDYSTNFTDSTTRERKSLHTRTYVLFTMCRPPLHTQLRAFWKLNEKWLIRQRLSQSDGAIIEIGVRLGGSLVRRSPPQLPPHYSPCLLG